MGALYQYGFINYMILIQLYWIAFFFIWLLFSLSVDAVLTHLIVSRDRANAQQPKLFVGMILILIFAEALALYGLIVGIILSSRAGQSRAE